MTINRFIESPFRMFLRNVIFSTSKDHTLQDTRQFHDFMKFLYSDKNTVVPQHFSTCAIILTFFIFHYWSQTLHTAIHKNSSPFLLTFFICRCFKNALQYAFYGFKLITKRKDESFSILGVLLKIIKLTQLTNSAG